MAWGRPHVPDLDQGPRGKSWRMQAVARNRDTSTAKTSKSEAIQVLRPAVELAMPLCLWLHSVRPKPSPRLGAPYLDDS